MNVIATARPASFVPKPAEHFDVLIVGAGISGVGSAYHLTTQLPGTSFVILESQESFGGTWVTHRYPGIRSDSDLHTFGYSFKPWTGPGLEADRKSTRLNSSHSLHDALPISGELWRPRGDAPLSRHPLRQRPSHLWLQLQALDRSRA